MGVFSKPAPSSAVRIAPTRPSIMSEGAMMSTPDRASETEVRASNSRLASFTISYSAVAGGAAAAAPRDCGSAFTIPQCPCDMYSHRQTSPITNTSRTSRLMARAAFCTMPSSAQAPVATSSFFSGSPNKMTDSTPRARVSRTSFTASSTERLKTPGIERTSFRIPVPGQMNSGYTKDSGVSRVSRTRLRRFSVRRKRRRRLAGNAIMMNSSSCRLDRRDLYHTADTCLWRAGHPRPAAIALDEQDAGSSTIRFITRVTALFPEVRRRRFFHRGKLAMVIQIHPTHRRVEYRRAAQPRRGEVKLHVDESFLLKSRRLKCRAPHQIHRRAAQVPIGGLQHLGVQHAAVLRVQNRVHDHGLKVRRSRPVGRIDAHRQAGGRRERERPAVVHHFRCRLEQIRIDVGHVFQAFHPHLHREAAFFEYGNLFRQRVTVKFRGAVVLVDCVNSRRHRPHLQK